MKESSCHDPKMVMYCQVDRFLEDKFDGLELNHIARRYNEEADQLAKMASGWEVVPTGVFANDLYKSSVGYPGLDRDGVEPPPVTTEAGLDPTPADEAEAMDIEPNLAMRDEPMPDWRIPYLEYLLADKTEAHRIVRWAQSFALIEGELYKHSATGVLQQCITTEEGIKLLENIHGGVCEHHAAPRTLVEKRLLAGLLLANHRGQCH
jgi:hypothetical protein